MSALIAVAALAALFVVFGLFGPDGSERPSCHGCPEEDGRTAGCEGCPLSTAGSPAKEVEIR